MPDTPINVLQPMRFEAGGIFRLTDGATDYAIRNREKGSLRIKFAGYDQLEWQELGLNQVPLEGDQQTPEIELEVKASKKETTGLYELLMKRNTSSNQGLAYVYTLVIDVPYYRGSATGHRLSFTNAFVVTDSVEYQGGERFDTVKFRMRATSMAALATY